MRTVWGSKEKTELFYYKTSHNTTEYSEPEEFNKITETLLKYNLHIWHNSQN